MRSQSQNLHRQEELKPKYELFSLKRSHTVAQAVIKLLILLYQSCSCIIVIGVYRPIFEFYYSRYNVKHLRSKINTEPSESSKEGRLK